MNNEKYVLIRDGVKTVVSPEEMCEFWKCQVEGLSKTLKERSDLLKSSYIKTRKLREALSFYACKDFWKITREFPTHVCRMTIIESSVDTEWFEEEKEHVSGWLARKALKDLEE